MLRYTVVKVITYGQYKNKLIVRNILLITKNIYLIHNFTANVYKYIMINQNNFKWFTF